MVSGAESVESRFPPEIEREIFELAVQTSPSSASSMMMVAYRVHQWIAPFLYRIARQFYAPYLPDVDNGGPSLNYFGQFVKHLFIGGECSLEKIRQFLSSCPNLIDLALLTHYPIKLVLDLLDNLKLQKIMTNMTSLREEDIRGSAAFFHVTHLDITALGKDLDRWRPLKYIPILTHVAINETVDRDVFQYLLQHCAFLKILLVVQAAYFATLAVEGSEEFCIYDPRFVMLQYSRYNVEEWENGANGEEGNIWICAEAISSAKHRGSLPKYRFCTWFTEYNWRAELDNFDILYDEEMDGFDGEME